MTIEMDNITLKKTYLHKKSYAMANVLHTSIYQIVSVFQDEILVCGSSIGGILC